MLQVEFSALEKLPFFEKSPAFTRGRSFFRGWFVSQLPGTKGVFGSSPRRPGAVGPHPGVAVTWRRCYLEALHRALGKALGARLGHPAGQCILHPRTGSVSMLGTQLQATRLVWRVESPPMSSLVPATAASPGQRCSRGEGAASRRTRRYRPG